MADTRIQQYFETAGLGGRVKTFSQLSATVEQAANALGCDSAHIAKTLSFLIDDKAILIVTAGDTKVDNKKFKTVFQQKARMIPSELVEEYTGHKPGGVCPFSAKQGVKVYFDISLKRFQTVYPAGGDNHSAVELSIAELEWHSSPEGWVDVCKGWSVNED